MIRIVALYGSPRRNGNTAALLNRAAQGASDAGASVDAVFLRDLHMSPCLELYGCKKTGRCVMQDDFVMLRDKLAVCDGVMLASPIFFYTVSAHTKIMIDRCQALWVKKYMIEKVPFGEGQAHKKGLFIAAGATRGRKLFDGTLLTIRYFFDALGVQLWRSLLYRGLDNQGDVLSRPDYLEEAYQSGRELVLALGL